MTGEGPTPIGSGEALGTGTVVLFAVAGAFTPTCSDHHRPGYVRRADELQAKRVDTVAPFFEAFIEAVGQLVTGTPDATVVPFGLRLALAR